MKHLLITLALIVSLPLSAQKGLHINDIFKGKVVSRQEMREGIMRGDNLAPYKLNVLHTASFTGDEAERQLADRLFSADMKAYIADDTDMEMESRGGFLYYAIVQLIDTDSGLHRYICYQCKEKAKRFDITVVYMEGKATLADLRKTFKKK